MSNNILNTSDDGVVSDREFTHMVTIFGQWNDHDLTFTPFSPSIRSFSNGVNCDESCERTEPCIPIPVSVDAQTQTPTRCFLYKLCFMTCGPSSFLSRFLLVTPVCPPAQTAASLRSDPPLFAGPDTPPTILAANPIRESRSMP